MRRCAPNFCQDFGEASELTTNAQRVASALHVYRAHTERIQGAHVKKIQRMHSVLLAHETNGPRMHHAFNAQPANGSGLRDCAASEVVLVDTISSNLRHHPWGSEEKWWWYPMATRCVHAWNTLQERWARYRFVQHSFSTPIFAACALDMR